MPPQTKSYSQDQTWAGLRLVTHGQSTTGLLYATPEKVTLRQNPITGAISSTTTRTKGIYVDRCALAPDAGTITCFGWRMHNSLWVAGQWDNSDAEYTDDTAGAQSQTSDAFSTGDAGIADDDGFIIGADAMFDWFSIDIDTNDVGGLADVVVEYSTASVAGVPAWTVIAAPWYAIVDQFTRTDAVIGTGATYFAALSPQWLANNALTWRKWTKAQAAAIGLNVPSDKYIIRVRVDAADPPTTTFATGSGMEIGGLIRSTFDPLTVDNVNSYYDVKEYFPHADGIVFYNTAAAGLATVTCAPVLDGIVV